MVQSPERPSTEMIWHHPVSPERMAMAIQTGTILEGGEGLARFYGANFQPAYTGRQQYHIGVPRDSGGIHSPDEVRLLKKIPPEVVGVAFLPIPLAPGQFVPQKFTNEDGWHDLTLSELKYLEELSFESELHPAFRRVVETGKR
jgi:hypothetical protein